MHNNHNVAFSIFAVDLNFFAGTARKYKRDAIALRCTPNACTPSFHLLSSLAFELFAKCLLGYEICLENKKDSIITEKELCNKIAGEMKKKSHNLCNIPVFLPEFCNFLNISKIEELKDDKLWEYRIYLKDGRTFFALKNIEAIRYGSFSTNKDIETICAFDQEIIDFLNQAENYVSKKREETRLELIKHFKPKS